jgi:hypothetical protein
MDIDTGGSSNAVQYADITSLAKFTGVQPHSDYRFSYLSQYFHQVSKGELDLLQI